MSLFGSQGQGWAQLSDLGIAFVLSALIGLEREYRQKSAGLRTYTVVGVAAALIMLVSKYGFSDVLRDGRIILDPSRVAAQIVTGIGFIGGGVIFMRRDLVRGLTTAAIVWLTAAVGMACGAALPILAIAVTGIHFVIVFAFPLLAKHLPRTAGFTTARLHLVYESGKGTLRRAIETCVKRGFTVCDLVDERRGERDEVASVVLTIEGPSEAEDVAAQIRSIGGAISAHLAYAGDDPIERAS